MQLLICFLPLNYTEAHEKESRVSAVTIKIEKFPRDSVCSSGKIAD